MFVIFFVFVFVFVFRVRVRVPLKLDGPLVQARPLQSFFAKIVDVKALAQYCESRLSITRCKMEHWRCKRRYECYFS